MSSIPRALWQQSRFSSRNVLIDCLRLKSPSRRILHANYVLQRDYLVFLALFFKETSNVWNAVPNPCQ